MSVPLLDLKAQYASIKSELDAAVARVFESQHFILGPEVEALEEELAAYCGAACAVGVSSGTDALLMALMDAGVGPGDEVITTPYSFFATAGAVSRLGARCVFVDIESESYNIDAEGIETRITERSAAIIPVHLFGRCADMGPISKIAKERDLFVIEDAAQAIGAEAAAGRRAGSLGDYGCFSFFPSKNLGAAGDGGLLTCGDAETAERLRSLRAHGQSAQYLHAQVGGNFRLDALQAAVLRVKLEHLDAWSAKRAENARRYRALLAETDLLERGLLRLPEPGPGRHVFNQYTVRVAAARRDALLEHLRARGIGCAIYYPRPLHLQPCFADWGYREGDFPVAEQAAREALSLPIYPELSEAQAAEVVGAVTEYLCRQRS